ncbi:MULTISPECIES: MarC family protein [unclassified Methylobacterium]|uniref:MarC family protein n=1 Tax=unclassified Methylobacterium TaxID=2615210 RepID=UPI0011C1E7FB|nr:MULTISPECIES: MarC family protein [unclassified Methylobacterium]QEE39498.1 MarC family protein [Methylobacterium sp. WL1]TXN57869.1 MarC family protein [Methylobacterium sp. WL2]
MSIDFTIQQFLLAFSGLIAIVNPIGGAFIFAQVTTAYSHAERVLLSRKIGVYAALVMLGALWAGTPILNFFGVTLAAMRIAGGLVVMSSAWTQLNRPEAREARKQAEASGSKDRGATTLIEASRDPAPAPLAEIAFFPLTLPFTTGPGTIAVAISLGANRPAAYADRFGFYLGVTLAALVVALAVALIYASADRVVALIGPARARVTGRLFAFLLLCVGTQILITGLTDVFAPLLAAR